MFLKADILGALKLSLLPAIVAILFTDLFDSISTFIGVAHAADLLDENGNPQNLRQGLIVDSFATLGAGLAGTSSGTAYIESIAGINSGGRTGLTSVFTALCFLPCLFIAPLAGMVPAYATAPVLLLVGASMFKSVSAIDFRKIEEGLARVFDYNPHPPDLLDHPGNSLGLHFARWPLSDCWPSQRDSSCNVRTRVDRDRVAGVGAFAVFMGLVMSNKTIQGIEVSTARGSGWVRHRNIDPPATAGGTDPVQAAHLCIVSFLVAFFATLVIAQTPSPTPQDKRGTWHSEQ